MVLMLFFTLVIYQDVIKVDNHKLTNVQQEQQQQQLLNSCRLCGEIPKYTILTLPVQVT